MKKMISWVVGALLIASAQLSLAADYQAGVHYKVLPKEVRTADPSKVEVVEMFGYWCPHCSRLEPVIGPWKKNLSDDVLFNPIPVVFRKNQVEVAKAYYIAKTLGVLDKAHQGMFDMIHKQNQMPRDKEQLARFFKSYGVSDKDFDKAYKSFATNSALASGRKKAADYQISSVPTMIVNGKYVVTPAVGGHKAMLDVVDYLVEQERLAQ